MEYPVHEYKFRINATTIPEEEISNVYSLINEYEGQAKQTNQWIYATFISVLQFKDFYRKVGYKYPRMEIIDVGEILYSL